MDILTLTGMFNNVVKMKPPMVFGLADVDKMLHAIDAALTIIESRRKAKL